MLAPVYIQIPGVPWARFHPDSIIFIYRVIITAVVPFSRFFQHGVVLSVFQNRLAIAVQFFCSVTSWKCSRWGRNQCLRSLTASQPPLQLWTMRSVKMSTWATECFIFACTVVEWHFCVEPFYMWKHARRDALFYGAVSCVKARIASFFSYLFELHNHIK